MTDRSMRKKLEPLLLRGVSEKELRTFLGEVAAKSGSLEDLDALVSRVFPEVFRTRSPQAHERIYRAFVDEPVEQLQRRVWRYRVQENGQPWIWISFPDSVDWKRIELIPFSDVHIGAEAHNEKGLDQTIDYVENNEYVFGFINGDLIENSLRDSVGEGVYEQIMRPHEQMEYAIKKFRRIAHKMLWAQPGNHEWRSKKHSDIDPLYWICRVLDIPYFDEPIYVDMLWKGNVFTAYAQHGATNSQTKGGKANAAARPLNFQDFVMFVVMGHVHDEMNDTQNRICRERIFDEEGKIREFRLVQRKQYVVIFPSYHGYFGTYAARQGYAPTSFGEVVLEIYPNGDYHVTG